jgi:hypothetical protein
MFSIVGDQMKHRVLVIIGEEDGWRVRLDGVDVVSFFGPYAQEWAVREHEELAQLLDAQSPYGNPLDHRGNVHQIWA